jgi:hypothetical protein
MSIKQLKHRSLTKEDYIRHTENAAKMLFEAIEYERKRYATLLSRHKSDADYYKREFYQLEDDDNVDPIRYNWAFGRYAEAETQQELARYSVDVLSTGIFQLAKQGIALLVDKSERCKQGRMIWSQHISHVIWNARNQAMHWDEGITSNPSQQRTIDCFKVIAADTKDDSFDLTKDPSCKATRVLALLGWMNYPSYLKDMESILV